MATLRMALAVPSIATNNAKSSFEATPAATKKELVFAHLSNLIAGIAGGSYRSSASGQAAPSLKLSIDENTTAATGTVTCVTVANNSTVNVAGTTFTGKTSAPSGNSQFLCGVSATADAAAFVAIVNAHPTASQFVKATSALGVVTLTAIGPALGVIGNGLILSSSDGTNLACVAFASGAADATAQTYSF